MATDPDGLMLEPTIAELARTVVASTPTATLAAVDTDGRPLLLPVLIVDDGSGAPVTVLSNLSPLVLRARQDARAGMLIGSQLMLQGDLTSVPGLQQLSMQPSLAARHPELARPMESIDYSWLRLVPSRVQWTDPVGTVHFLAPADLANAEPDPLAPTQADLVGDIAERLGDDLLLLAQGLVGRWRASDARLASVDRYGLVVEVDEPIGPCTIRIPFPQRLDAAAEIHAAVAGLRNAAFETPTARAQGRAAAIDLPVRAVPAAADDEWSSFQHCESGWTEIADEGANDDNDDEPCDGDEAPATADPVFVELPARRGIEIDWDGLEAAASVSRGAEIDGGGGADDAAIEVPDHRSSYSLMDSLERAGREARALAAQEQGDAFVAPDQEVGVIGGVVGRGRSKQ